MAQPPPKNQIGKNQTDKPVEPPPRRGRVAAIGQDASGAGAAVFARAGFSDPALVLHWVEIAGAEVARIARPARFSEKDGVLTLMAEPGAALFLSHESRELAARINAWLGRPAVTRIKFVQAELSQPQPRPVPPRPAKAPKAADPANSFPGPEGLKAALQSLARWRAKRENPGD